MALTLHWLVSLESGDFLSAANLSTQLAEYAKNFRAAQLEIVAYLSLELSPNNSRFLTSKDWYFKSLAISERLGTTKQWRYIPPTGTLADQQRDFSAAKRGTSSLWQSRKSNDNQRGIAISYHQLGFNAQEQRNFPASEQYYLKSWLLKKHLGDWYGIANTCTN